MLIRLILLITILKLSTFTSSAQTHTFLTQFSQSQTKSGSPFIYYKGIDQNIINAISKHIEREEMFNNRKYDSGKILLSDTLILTKDEKLYILSELKKQSDTNLWNQLQFPNSIIIPQDTLTAISKDTTKGWNYFSKVYGTSLYNFSIPIFFRNNQYCLFYYNSTCGIKCGEEVFAIYNKKKSTWSKWIIISDNETASIK